MNKIWELCGFTSKKEFEENFKTVYGTTFKDYINKL
jgi:transcriptional regulator GlxA family with amidase domain